jgi:hypothetical protein
VASSGETEEGFRGSTNNLCRVSGVHAVSRGGRMGPGGKCWEETRKGRGAKHTAVGIAAGVSAIRGTTSGAAVGGREWLIAYSPLCQPTWPRLRSVERGECLTVGIFNLIGPRGRGGRCSMLATIWEMRILPSCVCQDGHGGETYGQGPKTLPVTTWSLPSSSALETVPSSASAMNRPPAAAGTVWDRREGSEGEGQGRGRGRGRW